MKYFFAVVVAAALFSCNDKKEVPNTDLDVARTFLKDVNENNFKDAAIFLLKEETNSQLLDRYEMSFKSKTKEDQENYKNADIIINEYSNVNDSVTIVNYSNTYKKESKNKVKVVKVNGKWLIDLKYTISGNM